MTSSDDGGSLSVRVSTGHCGLGLWVERRLAASRYLALRRILCECRGCVLSLRGCVPTHYLKQVARAIAGEVVGVGEGADAKATAEFRGAALEIAIPVPPRPEPEGHRIEVREGK
jgi:hypothetical protein